MRGPWKVAFFYLVKVAVSCRQTNRLLKNEFFLEFYTRRAAPCNLLCALRKLRETSYVSSRISHAVLFTREDLRSLSAVSPRIAFIRPVCASRRVVINLFENFAYPQLEPDPKNR